ncbi:caspase family protein [Stenotrophomonas geniculata]|jgi:Caspase domain|uniref:caspase family protein n=1 Tax=Stenotrophomonas geniculata TaxID=86188 RepID=UPI00383B9645
MRRICISIGVSRAEGLAPLRAAATAAEEIGTWAELSGFAQKEDIRVLTDRVNPVTIERIAQAFLQLLPIGKKTDGLLLHFAGHGLREDNTRTLWLPTNWRSQLRAIAVERLKNRLSDFGIDNVTIISDACKGLANDKETSDLTPDGVLGAGISAGKRPIFDRYDAVHDVESAFMIPGPTPEEARCIFSGALVEALWGAPEALDPHYPGKVTPGSLADYLTTRVDELCATYQLNCQPQCLPGRPPDHLIYFDRSGVHATDIPVLPSWPKPAGIIGPVNANSAAPISIEKSAFDDYQEGLPHGISPWAGEITDTGRKAQIARSILGGNLEQATPDISPLPSGRQLSSTVRLKLAHWIRRIEHQETVTTPSGNSNEEREWLRNLARADIEKILVDESKTERQRETRALFRNSVTSYNGNANLVLGGAPASAIWSSQPIYRVADNRWISSMHHGRQQLIVEYEDGVCIPLLTYRRLMTIAVRDDRGTNGWLLHSPNDSYSAAGGAIDILMRMQSGDLPPSEVPNVAAFLRRSKHGNPVIGAICSYLYDYAGDLENIRRMAYYFASRHQPIPYDIALMGDLKFHWRDDRYVTQVPATEAISAARPDLPYFTNRATPKIAGEIAGFIPWLRQGWDFLDERTDSETALNRTLLDLRDHLHPQTFTSLSPSGAQALARLWKMERWK